MKLIPLDELEMHSFELNEAPEYKKAKTLNNIDCAINLCNKPRIFINKTKESIK